MSCRLALLATLCVAPCPLQAQWHLALTGGPAGASGHSLAPDDGDSPQLRPAPTRDLSFAVGRDAGPWRATLRVRRTHADLVIAGTTAGITTSDILRATAVGAEFGRRIVGRRHTPSVVASLGVATERWSFHAIEGESRSRTLATAALEGEVPFTRDWLGLVRVEAAAGGSLFEVEELPGGYESRRARRTALHLGIRWAP